MPATASVTIAARVLATLNGPGSGARAVIRSPLGPTAVKVLSWGPTSTSSACQSASGWPSAEKVVTGTPDSVMSLRPYSSSKLTTPRWLRSG